MPYSTGKDTLTGGDGNGTLLGRAGVDTLNASVLHWELISVGSPELA